MRVKGTPTGNHNERNHDSSSNNDTVDANVDVKSLKSTGKGAKKRRVGIVVDEAEEAEAEDDEDDYDPGSGRPPAPDTGSISR